MVRTSAAGPAGPLSAVPSDAPDDVAPVVPAGLTPAQREAVTALDRVLCVLAGAGTGKTRVLTLRVARRVHDGTADADHVLVCTFSRKAADELRRRLWSLHVGDEVQAGTFHRTALRLLGQHRADRGLPPPVLLVDRRTTLATVVGLATSAPTAQAEARRGAARRPRIPRLPAPHSAAVGQLEAEIGWAKARLVAPAGYEEAARAAHRRPSMGAARVAELYGRYEEAKRRQGVLDLDDLLWACADALEGDDRFAAAVRWRFRHLFVDEMQDVNPSQFRLLRALVGEDPDLFVVGDPHQSVYGWNGADPGLLDRLPATCSPRTRVVRLDENHRCSPQVVAVASAALGLEGEAAPTSTRPDGAVPRVVHAAHRGRRGRLGGPAGVAGPPPGPAMVQIAVLARTNAQLAPVAEALRAERIPARLAGGDLGPASDLRPRADRGPDADHDHDPPDDERGGERGGTLRGGRRRRRPHHLPPGQGPAVAGRLRDRALRRAGADLLGPHQGGPGRGTATALRGPHPGRGRAHLHLGRPAGLGLRGGRDAAAPAVPLARGGDPGRRVHGRGTGRRRSRATVSARLAELRSRLPGAGGPLG